MRNTSQRPSPSRSLDRSTLNPSSTSSSRTHSRSQSTTTHNHEHVYSSPKVKTTYFDRNDGGWLESSPVQLSASTSHSPLQNSQHTEHVTNEGSTKDMLGTISNDDILKLTQLTNKLPMVSTKHNHIQKEHSHTSQRQHMVEDELLHDGPTDHNYSRHVDTGLTNLLNQDFMRSSPLSDTEDSALLTIPSCNPSTISTDTDDGQLSWHNTTASNSKFSEQPALLRKPLSEQTTATAAAEKIRSYHPLTVSTTALYAESDLTPSSSQATRHSKRRYWYRYLMKRDKKGKTKYNDSPTTNNDESSLDIGYDTDEPPSNIYHTLQHEPTMIESNIEYHNLRSSTHPMANMATNDLNPLPSSDISTRKRHGNLSIHRFRLPTRRKRQSSFGTRDDPSPDIKAAIGDKQQQRRQLYGRRHSFDNIREYDLPSHETTNAQRHMTTTSARASGKTRKQHGKSLLNSHDALTANSHLSSTPSIASTTSSLLAPTSPYIPSSNIPASPANGNDSPRNNSSSTLALGTPRTDVDDLELEDNETDRSGIGSSPHQPIIEITPALSQQQDDNQRSQKTLYFDYDSLPWDNMDGEPQGVKALVKRMVDNGYGKMTETYIKPGNDVDDDEEENDHLDLKMDEDIGSSVDKSDGDGDNDDHIENMVDIMDSRDPHGGTPSTIESSKVIGGDAYYVWLNKRRSSDVKTGTRLIAEIHVAAENDTGFFKLTQLAEETMLIKGRLLNLYVSFLVPGKTDDDMASNYQETSILDQNMGDRLLSLNPFIDDAQVFLNERTQRSGAFAPMSNTQQQQQLQQRQQYDQYRGSRKNSDSSSETGVRCTNTPSCSLSSFSFVASILPSSTSNTQQQSVPPPPLSSPHSNGSSTCLPPLWNYVPCQQYSVYDYRQEQLRDAISDLRRGVEDFKRSLKETENTLYGVQIDMHDTKAKMDTYLKDVPETHYSELKRLEVSIESILANRAKSRGMELLYWLLTALLTGSAFLLWAVICILKLGQTVISFPGKMIKAFNEHMEERNKEVKQAGMRIVAKDAERPPSFGQPRAHSDELNPSPPTTTTTMDVPNGSTLRRSSSSSRRASYSQPI